MKRIVDKIVKQRMLIASLPREAFYVVYDTRTDFLFLRILKLTPEQVHMIFSDETDHRLKNSLLIDQMPKFTKYLRDLSYLTQEWESDAPGDQIYDLLFDKSQMGTDFPDFSSGSTENFLFGPFDKNFLHKIPEWLIINEIRSWNLEDSFELYLDKYHDTAIKFLKRHVSKFSISASILRGSDLEIQLTGKFYLPEIEDLEQQGMSVKWQTKWFLTAFESFSTKFLPLDLIKSRAWKTKEVIKSDWGGSEIVLDSRSKIKMDFK